MEPTLDQQRVQMDLDMGDVKIHLDLDSGGVKIHSNGCLQRGAVGSLARPWRAQEALWVPLGCPVGSLGGPWHAQEGLRVAL